MIRKFLFSVYLLIFCNSFSQSAYDCSTLKSEQSLHSYATIIDVDQQKYSVEFIKNNFQKSNPQKLKTENDDLGFTNHYFWIQFQVENTSNTTITFFIETARPVSDFANLYILNVSSNAITKFENGDLIPYFKKQFSDRKVIFKITIAPKTKLQYYLNLKSDGEVLKIPIVARTTENLMQLASKEQLLYGVFYGILAIAAIIYLFFFFALREKTLLFYSLYVIFIGLMQFAIDGFFHQYITPQAGWFSEHAVLFFAIIATFLLGKYCEVFLKVKYHVPLLYKFFTFIYLMALLLLLSYLMFPNLAAYCYPLANVLGLIFLILIISSIFILYSKKIKVDPYFRFGILFLILGFVIFILNNFGLVANTFFTQNSSKFGTGFEIIFLSLSMSNLIRNLKNDKNELIKLELARSLEMNELKSYFLSNISHELRTPLNAIINLNEANSKASENENIKKNCDIINYSSQSLLGSVNDLLDFSKIQKNQLALENKPFDIKETFKKIKSIFEIQAADKNLKFNYSIQNQIENFVVGDETRLVQIVTNLLNNSVKFTSNGFVNLKVTFEQKSISILKTVIIIEDSGIGIDTEKRVKIFDSFSQNNINNKRKFGGLGLGLYIVKTLVDMHEGLLKMESIVNVGTTFEIALEYKIGEPIAKEKLTMHDYDLKNAKILYVEDNKMNQMVIKMIIKKWKNTNLDIVENGQECLSILENNNYDLILMDLQMPVMDGFEATIAIRKGNSGINKKDIPIIAVTADVMETTKQTVFDIGMNDYLTKPIDKELLFERIIHLLQ